MLFRRSNQVRLTNYRRWGLPAVLLAGAILSGCKLGPDYERPALETPGAWRWKVAEPRDHVPRGDWWQVFGDPVLNELEQQAAARNQDLKVAVARVEQARATARVSRADLFPYLQGQGSFTRYRTSGNSPSPVTFPVPSFTQQQWTVPLDLSYEIDLWGRVRRSFESARLSAQSAAAAHNAVLLSLQADVAATYFTLQTTEREIDLLEQTVKLRSEALQIFEQRLNVGMGSEYEVERGRVEVAAAEADLQRVQRQRAENLNSLALLCGEPPSHFKVQPSSAEPKLPVIAPDLPASLLERRPDIAEAERELASRLAQIGVAKAAFFPAVQLTARGGFLSGEVNDLFNWESRVWSLGPAITLPIFAGGRNRANLQRAQATYEEGVARYRQSVLIAFREVEDTLAALQFLEHEVRARRTAAEAATKATRLSFERYRAGAVNFLEVVDSENARLFNEVARLRIANEQQLATVRLIKAVGGGWE